MASGQERGKPIVHLSWGLVPNVVFLSRKEKKLQTFEYHFHIHIISSNGSKHLAVRPINVDSFSIWTSFRVVESGWAPSANSYLDMAFFSSKSASLKPDRRT